MPVFGLAAMWKGSAPAERVRELVEGLDVLMPSAKPPSLMVALREEEANLELKVEVASYPRVAVERLKQQVSHSGGTLVELWRLPKEERDTFRAASLTGPKVQTLDNYPAAARLLARHLQELATRSLVPSEPPATPPGSAEHASKRRARRFAVRLEMEFHTELDFVREHATNISNGGLFVRTAHRPPVDSVVPVSVKLPNGEHLQGDALVVHVLDDPYTGGVGLAFLNEEPAFVETLDRYLASLAEQP